MTAPWTRRGAMAAIGSAIAFRAARAEVSWRIEGSQRGTIRLAFATDHHARTDLGVPDALDMAADAISAERPDLTIAGGDLVQGGGDAEWALWDRFAARAGGSIHAVIGNRDCTGLTPGGPPSDPDPKAAFRARLGLESTWRVVDALGWRIFLLDPIRPGGGRRGYDAWIGTAQQNWLRAELARTDRAMPLIAVSHIPFLTAHLPATEGPLGPFAPDLVTGNATDVLRLFRDHNLVLVLQGHLHVAEMLQWNQTAFVTGGAVSANWWRGAHYGTEEGFSVFDLNPDRATWRYADYGWSPPRPD